MFTKRVVALADLHCGHRVGLTPPAYQWRGSAGDAWDKYAKIQRETWAAYARLVKALRPIHALFMLGDAIDGRGERSGGVELITGDRAAQCDMAAFALAEWRAQNVVIVRGTPYHSGEKESWEDEVAARLKVLLPDAAVSIGNHEWPTVVVGARKICFDLKHKIGRSSIPHGRATPLSRDMLWGELWAEAGLQPRGDWILRAHVHYCEGSWHYRADKRISGLILPALQAMGTRYGAQECSGLVDWGLVSWDISEKEVVCTEHVEQIASQRALPTMM